MATPRFLDDRGAFIVPFEAGAARALGLPDHFVQDNHSLSHKVGTIRGIHLQLPPFAQGKLVRVLRGRIADVVVDLRPGSATLFQHRVLELDAESGQQLWVPAGFGHGFCTLEPDTEVFYKVDAPYQPRAERTLAWDDPTVGVAWPLDGGEPVLSDKDAVGLDAEHVLGLIEAAAGGGTEQ